MPKPIRAVIFDLGGVLVRTEDLTPRQQLAAELNLPMSQLYDIVFNRDTWISAQLGCISNDDHWQAVGRRLKLTWPDQVHAFRAAFFAGDRLDREMMGLIQRLHSQYKVALLSNAPGNLRRWIAEEWNVPQDTFDLIVISAEEGVMKPDHKIFRRALARLDIAPDAAIFVDDFAENVAAARALGMEAIHFTSPQALLTELTSRIEVPAERPQ